MSGMNPHHIQAIGEKLRGIRQERQLSLRELAKKAEISASMLSQIENGKAFPSVRSIYSIAAALAVSVDYFFPDLRNTTTGASGSEIIIPEEMTASEMREAQINQGFDPIAMGSVSPAPHSSPIVHCESRPTIELNGGVTWMRLTALAESRAEFLEIKYDPGAMSGAHMSNHEGREFGLILEGVLVVELGFETYPLTEGDSIIFDSETPHRLVNKSSKIMRAIWVVLNRS
jgi:transcriptional regulator with XRE-family HTH domain/quercetin dioxygenase-like cupin family protein